MASLYYRAARRLLGRAAPPGPAVISAILIAPVLIVAVLLATVGCGGGAPARPNVLLVVISGLRADHVSAYGYARATTPSLDDLASSGSLFEQAIATSSWGLSSQASILTGLYPSEHSAAFDHPVVDGSIEMLAEKLKTAGYSTVAISTDRLIGATTGFMQGFDAPVEVQPDGEASPDEGAAAAEAALESWLAGREPSDVQRPFFAYVVLSNPQLPFNPPGEYRQKFLDRPIPVPRLDQLSQYWLPFARQFTLGMQTLSPEDMSALVALYDGEVAYADYRLGRIIGMLRSRKILDQTLVVVTSDAGEDLGDHGLLASASRLYDSIVRVPLVMRLPGRIPSGQRMADQVQTLDIAPAVIDLTAQPAVGEAAPPSGAGVAPPIKPRPVAVCEARVDPVALRYYRALMPSGDLSLFESNMLAARTPQHKYIVTSNQRAALFDLKADPGETASVLTSEADAARRLAQQIQVWSAGLKAPPRPPPTARTATPPASETKPSQPTAGRGATR